MKKPKKEKTEKRVIALPTYVLLTEINGKQNDSETNLFVPICQGISSIVNNTNVQSKLFLFIKYISFQYYN